MGYYLFRAILWLALGALAWLAVLTSVTVIAAESVSGWHVQAVYIAAPGVLVLARWCYRLWGDVVT